MAVGDGDRLASGRNSSASWGPLNVSQDKWDAAVGKPKAKRRKRPRKKAKD
jgi:hypothetical protein